MPRDKKYFIGILLLIQALCLVAKFFVFCTKKKGSAVFLLTMAFASGMAGKMLLDQVSEEQPDTDAYVYKDKSFEKNEADIQSDVPEPDES